MNKQMIYSFSYHLIQVLFEFFCISHIFHKFSTFLAITQTRDKRRIESKVEEKCVSLLCENE